MMEIIEQEKEGGVAIALIDGRRAFKMAHLRSIFPAFLE